MLRPLWRLLLPLAALLLVRAQEEGSSDDDKPKESKTKESSKLAPTVGYTGLHSFLHGGVGSPDKLPKVLLLLGSADADTPEWYTSAAMSFKEGKKKSVSFAVIKADGEKTAHRFGFAKEDELPRAGLLVVCLVDGSGSGTYARYKGSLVMGGGTSVKAVKEFVKGVINEAGDEEQQPLPPFPPPDTPRKQASVSLLELSYDNLPTHCFGGPKAICIIALLPEGGAKCPGAVAELAKRHRNDPVQFAWLRAHKQEEFVQGFGLELAQLPQLVAVKVGKRSRFALLEGDMEAKPMGGFVDRILGGDMSFKALKPLPELEPPYLQGMSEEEDGGGGAARKEEEVDAEDKVEL
jgi:hypothetical protein